MENRVQKNYIFNLIQQIFTLIVPIIVTPYLSKVLGSSGTGQYTFASVIMSYFHLFANLGFENYSQRLIAKYQNDKKMQDKSFWEIIILKTFTTLFILLIYIICILTNIFPSEYRVLLIILSLNLIDVIFDINFYFRGNEQFSKIVTRNIIVKIISIICIFIFVNKAQDLWIYTLIQSLSVILGNISLWFYIPKNVSKVKITDINLFQHIKPVLLLFIPTIAISIYTTLDKFLIGILIDGDVIEMLEDGSTIVKQLSDIENGNYEYSEKLVKITLTIITSLGAVMLPNNSKKISDGKLDEVHKNINNSLSFTWMLGIPLVLGIIVISDNLVPWYLGDDYTKAALLLKLLSPLILIIGISNVLGIQYLVPAGKDKKYTLSVLIGCGINILLNLLFIPKFLSYGAAVATVIAEFTVTVIMIVIVNKDFKITKALIPSWKYIVSGVIMFIICFLINSFFSATPIATLITILLGAVIYFTLLTIFKDEQFLSFIKNFKHRK